MSAAIERKRAEREAAGEPEPDDSLRSGRATCPTNRCPETRADSEAGLPAGRIVSVLQSLKAPHDEIRQLNALFTDFRTCGTAESAEDGRCLGDQIESLSKSYPDLVSRVADFRSRIDERVRSR